MKVAFSGTHGTGKTHSAYLKAAELKRGNPGREVGILTGVERECPLPINRSTSFDAQMWIFARQIAEEIRLSRIYDILVCDRTLMDIIAYTVVALVVNDPGAIDYAQRMYSVAEAWMPTYDTIWFRPAGVNDWCMDDGVRDMDRVFRLEVDELLSSLYQQAGCCCRVEGIA